MAKEGFYMVEFADVQGFGTALIALDNGPVVGCDVGAVTYDGTYSYNQRSDTLDVDITSTVPVGTKPVTLGSAATSPTKFTIKASMPKSLGIGQRQPITINTSRGPVAAVFSKI